MNMKVKMQRKENGENRNEAINGKYRKLHENTENGEKAQNGNAGKKLKCRKRKKIWKYRKRKWKYRKEQKRGKGN